MIRVELEKAGRLNDVKNILNGIISDNKAAYPVRVFVNDDGQLKWNVDTKSVRKEAKKLLNFLDSEVSKKPDFCFENLLRYVSNESDTMLHNYAVTLSHRHDPKIDMETIRNWQILENLLLCWSLQIKWTIPEGWKKLDSLYPYSA